MTDTTPTEPLKIHFEFGPCTRCSGSGRFGPSSVEGGRCFGCKGEGKHITRNGSRALDRYNALMAERMSTPVEDITEGMRVYSYADRFAGTSVITYSTRWRTVRAVLTTTHQHTSNGEVVETRAATLCFEESPEGKSAHKSAPVGEPLTFITPDREVHEKIMIEIARRFKGAWLEGEEPPAPPVRKPRVKMEEPKPVETPPPPRTFPNRYASDCGTCGALVEEKAGECFKDGTRWVVRHTEGQCPQQAEEVPAEDAPEPPQAAAPVTEEGMYRTADGSIFRVQTSEAGRLYAKRFYHAADGKGASLEYEGGAIRRLCAADRMTADEAAEVGRSFGICIVCAKVLSNPRSLALGIGPVCRKRVEGDAEVSAPAPTVATESSTPAKSSQCTPEGTKVGAVPAKENKMIKKNPTMADVMAATPEQLTTMMPPQIDTLNAALSEEYARLDSEANQAWEKLYRALLMSKRPVTQGRSTVREWPIRRDEAQELAHQHIAEGTEPAPSDLRTHRLRSAAEYTDGLRAALARIEAVGDKTQALNQGPHKVLTGEWDRRGGWPRFFTVPDGHMHRDQSCFTLKITTVLNWHPELSGRSDAEAVAKEGPYLCTFCYPSAPTEWKQNPEAAKIAAKAATECPGSRQHAQLMDPRRINMVSRSAPCHVCGKKVAVTSALNLRAHDKPQTAPEAPQETPVPATPAPAAEEPQTPPSTPKKVKAPATPSALHVSSFLANAGFQRSSSTTRTTYEGFKLSEMKGYGSTPTKVSVRWVESSYEGERRLWALGLDDFSQLPDNPKGPEMAAAYADALSARYRVERDGTHIWVHVLDKPRRAAKGRPVVKAVSEVLRDNALPRYQGARGYSNVTGCALVQEADHVRIQVRPWEYVQGWTKEELNAAAVQVTSALDAAGYVYTRADDVNSAVIKVIGKRP